MCERGANTGRHSPQKTVNKRMRKLNQILKCLKLLSQKYNQNAHVIILPVHLRELRQKFSPQYQHLSQSLINSVSIFQRVPINSNCPLFIYGKDRGLITYRACLNDLNLLSTLIRTIQELLKRTDSNFRGIDREDYFAQHYCIWCPYAQKPFLFRELQDDGEARLEFLRVNCSLWNRLSNILRSVAPNVYKDFLQYPLPDKIEQLCSAWAGCVVNIPVHTKPHRDVKQSKFGYSCVVPAGDYTRDRLICYELKLIIELAPETCFFFPDSLIQK